MKKPSALLMIAMPKPGDPGSPPQADSDQDSDFCVPASALQVDGTKPEQGDEVSFTVKGKVSSVDGETICVTPTEINGQPYTPPDDSDDEGNEDEGPSSDDVMKAAQDADAQGGPQV